MMTSKQFKELWLSEGDELLLFPEDIVKTALMPDDDKAFILEAGLPSDAPPYLSFGQNSIRPLEQVSDVWKLPLEFSVYRTLGSTGSGDPICIDESHNGCVVCLAHDNDFKRIFMNSSIRQLAECLLAYRYLVNEAIRINGDDAYLDGNIPDSIIQMTRNKIKGIDQVCMDAGAFWSSMLE